jgi:4-amino-4-deoxychorismate lyase
MSLLLESIKVLDGVPLNLAYHNSRMDASRKVFFGATNPIDLARAISVPDFARAGIFKCRVVYGASIESIEFLPYELPKISRIKLVFDDRIRYDHKMLDRNAITRLFDLRGDSDDIIVVRNGLLTDASFANIALFDDSAWYTPRHPLLRGTKRQALLDCGILLEADIAPSDLHRFTCLSPINAMIELGELTIPIEAIQPRRRSGTPGHEEHEGKRE